MMDHLTVQPAGGDEQLDIDLYTVFGGVASGKTTALQTPRYEDGFEVCEFGEVAREIYEQEEDTTLSLSQWAGQMKDENGPGWVARELIEILEDGGLNPARTSSLVVSGLRSPEEMVILEDYFGRSTRIWIWATFYTRMERYVEREDKTPRDFFERDIREREWGLNELTHRSAYDVWVPNESQGLSELESYMRDIMVGQISRWDLPDEDLKAPWHQYNGTMEFESSSAPGATSPPFSSQPSDGERP